MEGTATRFEMELELMNCLASPEYLHCECGTLSVLTPWYLRPLKTSSRLSFITGSLLRRMTHQLF